jgi:iron complex transport system ATP-binding protein
MSTAVQVFDLSCRRGGREVLAGVELSLRYGEVLVLVGPNGAGKSTLLSVLAGDRHQVSGDIELAGRPLGEWTAIELARQRSVLLQANEVSFGFTTDDVIGMGRSPWRGTEHADTDEAAIASAVRDADVDSLLGRRFNELSGGERARVSLARVLAQRTPLVLLDEPTAALDLRHQEQVMAICRGLAARGRAVVVVLHDLSLAAAWADRIAVLDAGRLVAVGPVGEVLSPDRIAEVYRIGVEVLHSSEGYPIVVPRRSDILSGRTS